MNPFIEHCGITFTQEGDLAIGRIELNETHKNPYGYVHGGVLYTLADTVAGFTLRLHDFYGVTVNCDFHYMKNLKEGHIYGVPEIISIGRSIAVIRVTVYGEGELKLSEGTFTYYRIQN